MAKVSVNDKISIENMKRVKIRYEEIST